MFYQLGLYEAPVIDTADPLRHGYGADALAFRFNRNGVLIAPPAYIAQESPNDFYTRRIGSLTLFRATVHDVEAIFARAHTFAARPDGFMWYYALEIIIRLRTTAAITIDLASLTLPPLTFLIRI